MPESLGDAVLTLRTDDARYNRQIRAAHGKARGLDSQFRAALGSLTALFAARGIASAASGLFRSFSQAARTTENLRLRLDALLGSTEEGARAFKLMREFASSVPFEFEEIMGSATQLAGIVEGGADEIAGLMPIIADLAAVSGLSIQQTTEQIVRAFSAGIGSADLFRERGITAMLGFQAGATVSADETRRQIIAAWQDTESKFRGASERMAGTWDGIMSMISDLWFNMRVKIIESDLASPILESVKQLLKDMITLLQTESENLSEAFHELGVALGAALMRGFATALLLEKVIREQVLKALKLPQFIIDAFNKLDIAAKFSTALIEEMDEVIRAALINIRDLAVQAREAAGGIPGGGGVGGGGGRPLTPNERAAAAGFPTVDLGRMRGPQLRGGLMEFEPLPIARAWEDVRASMEDADSAVNKMAQTMRSQFASAISGVVFGLRSFEGALFSVIEALAQQFIQALVTSAIPVPGFQSGGVVPGPIGAPRLALVHGGETVVPTAGSVRLELNMEGAPWAHDPLGAAAQANMLRWLDEQLQDLKFAGRG